MTDTDFGLDIVRNSFGLLSPQQKGNNLRTYFKNIPPEKKGIDIPPGEYDFGDLFVTLPGVVIDGENRTRVTFKCADRWGSPKYPSPSGGISATAFAKSHLTTLKNVTLISTVEKNRQAAVLGYGVETVPSISRVSHVENCRLIGAPWGAYYWQNTGDSCTYINCDIDAGNVCLMLGKSVPNGQLITVLGCRFNVNPELTTQGGATTNPYDGGSIAVVIRGGTLTVDRLFCNVTGQNIDRGPNLCAIQDYHDEQNGASSDSIRIRVSGLTTLLRPYPGRKLTDYKVVRDISYKYGEVFLGGENSWATSPKPSPLQIEKLPKGITPATQP